MSSHLISASARNGQNGKLLAGAAWIALIAASGPAQAGTYHATDDASLRAAIASAEADADASGTIILDNDVSLAAGNLPATTKPITIDTGGHTLTSVYQNGSSLGGAVNLNGTPSGSIYILNGSIQAAGAGAGANGNGDQGLFSNAGKTITITGTLTGGAGGGLGGNGARGVSLTGDSSLTNSGTITGGGAANGNGGTGVNLSTGASLSNSGIIKGGDGSASGGGGVSASSVPNITILNSGTIQGGAGTTGTGGAGVSVIQGNSLTSSGTITGGEGATGGAGVSASGASAALISTVNNSGTITGGKGTSAAGGVGVSLGNFTSFTNDGTVLGGDGQTGGTAGVNMGGTTGPATLINHGTIRGGNNATGAGGSGVIARTTSQPIINSGTIQGGIGGAGISITTVASFVLTNSGTVQGGAGGAAIVGGTIANASVSVTNSGTLAAGTGYANAIETQNATTAISLELRKGSTITGNVVGNSGVTNTLTLGGDEDASFDVSAVGPQYQNFTSFQKTGNSVWTLTGTGGAATPWTISAGTLQLVDGASILGDITNNATLAFNRNDSSTFASAISGSGAVTKSGTGTTILTGDSSYSGLTTVSGGTLRVDGSLTGSDLAIQNGALIVNGAVTPGAFTTVASGGTLTVNGSLTGSALTVQSGGVMSVSGTAAPTTVSAMAGLLTVNGSFNSALTVQSGGTVAGNGTLVATTIQSGGTVAPGNSIGTLHVNGAFTQNAGSIYQVEVDPTSSAADLIQVNGTATLDSGAGLKVVKNPAGEYRLGTVYRVLTATGGLTGRYAVTGETSGVSAFLGLRDSYDANNAYLTVVQTRDPAEAATTPNQQQVAANLPDPIVPPVLNLPSDQAARDAFDQLSAQALASAKGALVSNGLYVRDATLDRLRDVRCRTMESRNARDAACESDQPSLWAQGFGGWGGVTGNANAAGLNRSTAGMLAGFDLPVMGWRLGMFGGFSHSDFRLTGGPASGRSADYHLGAYGGTDWDGVSLSLGASYSWNTVRTDRGVAFGTFTDRLQATYDAGVTQLFADAGYGMDMFGLTLEPFANLAYLNLRTGGFTETGGAAALTVRADTIENAITTFGIRPSTTVDLGSFPVTLRGMAGWRHTFGAVTPTSTVAFAGGNAFTISGAPIARDAMALEAGFDFALGDNISAGLTYGGQLSSRSTDQTARGTLRIAF